jgi:diguanylate cyclase (GGDEF)-like protein
MTRIHGIAPRLIIALVLGFAVPLALGLWVVLHDTRQDLENELHGFHEKALHSLVHNTRDALLAFSPGAALNSAKMIILDPRILRVRVYSSIYGMYLVDIDKNPGHASFQTYSQREVVYDDNERLGFVEVTTDRGFIRPLLKKEQEQVALFFTAMLVGGLGFVLPFVYIVILRPIRRLTRQAEALARGELDRYQHWDGRDELSMLGRTMESMRHSLNASFSRIHDLAVTDELTGISNRRAFMMEARKNFEKSTRYNRPFSVAMADLDNFKLINDRYGHTVGDEVLREFARVAGGMVRASDVFARIGGEEFALFMPETSLEQALMATEKIRAAVEGHSFTHRQRVTVSFGVAQHAKELSFEEVMRKADDALYRAKGNGRNRVVVSDHIHETKI